MCVGADVCPIIKYLKKFRNELAIKYIFCSFPFGSASMMNMWEFKSISDGNIGKQK